MISYTKFLSGLFLNSELICTTVVIADVLLILIMPHPP